MKKVIQMRRMQLVNTDPLRRCYNGCHFSTALIWTPWEDLCDATEETVQDKLNWWRELNDDAVKCRGESALREFRIKETGDANIPTLS